MRETPATRDDRLLGVTHTVLEHPRAESLKEAAAMRGFEPSALIKTIVVRRGEGDYLFVLVPGDRVIDWPKLRSYLGVRRLSMPSAEEALDITGYVRGTITPLGATRALPIVADSRLADRVVSIGGGAHGVSISVDADQLFTALEVSVSDITHPQTD